MGFTKLMVLLLHSYQSQACQHVKQQDQAAISFSLTYIIAWNKLITLLLNGLHCNRSGTA